MTRPSFSRRKFLKFTGALSASVFSGATASLNFQDTRPKPNILFLLTDDQRWDTLSCMGNSVLKTPNIDKLAASGVTFNNAFVTTSICPSNRASILTGQHMRTHGIRDFSDSLSPDAFQKTYPALLRNAGYRTGFIGKYGIGSTELAKDHFDYWRGLEGQGSYFQEIDGEKLHSTHIMAVQSGEFLRSCSKNQPWCLSVSFKAPHHPWHLFDPNLAELFENQQMPLTSSATREAENSQPDFIRDSLNGSRWWNLTETTLQEWIRNHYRLIKGVDIAVGQIIKDIHELGFSENTCIIFTSDNGYLLYEHGLLGKWLMYEESIRIPMIIYDPRAPKALRGQRRNEMVLSIDCAPTMLTTAGVPIPPEMQGKDLTPLIMGNRVPWRDDWFYEHTYTEKYPRNIPNSQGVRTSKWKYNSIY